MLDLAIGPSAEDCSVEADDDADGRPGGGEGAVDIAVAVREAAVEDPTREEWAAAEGLRCEVNIWPWSGRTSRCEVSFECSLVCQMDSCGYASW